jgi:hypothetical protein
MAAVRQYRAAAQWHTQTAGYFNALLYLTAPLLTACDGTTVPAYSVKTYGKNCYSRLILCLGSGLLVAVSFTPRPLYLLINWIGGSLNSVSDLHALDKRKTSSWLLMPSQIPSVFQPEARSLYWLSYPGPYLQHYVVHILWAMPAVQSMPPLIKPVPTVSLQFPSR